MPATTTATPLVMQETPVTTQLPATSRYFMVQSAPMVPAVPVLNTTYVYPRYGFVPKPVETSVNKEEIEKSQPTTQLVDVQHVVHHHYPPYGHQTCAGYCDLCCPWIEQQHHHHHTASRRQSRRDDYERDEFDRVETNTSETIDEKIERIRRELRESTQPQRDHSTESIEHHIHHYPRPRSSSGNRSTSATREPWRSTNQNDYAWRDAHLPAYRQATLARSQTPVNESRTWTETAHDRSHRNTSGSNTYYSKKDYVYRPRSETEAKKHYTQTTGKDADREVYQALRGGTTTYEYRGTPVYDRHQCTSYGYTDASTSTTTGKVHQLRKIDSTNHHDLYSSNHSTLHVIPKQGSTMDPPYMKIMNAPVTYIH